MREIVGEVIAELEREEAFALVTLISERGSTPRALGAQMLVRRDGSIAGTIGGGLLEATMMQEAAAVLDSRRSRVASLRMAGKSLTEEEMLCGGSAEVLVAYVSPGDAVLRAVASTVADAVAASRRAWLFTFFTPAPAPAETDVAYCAMEESGELLGDAPCSANDLRTVLGKVGVHGSATLPDGRRVHAETVDRPATAVICGAGHVALALAPVAARAGFQVVVLDDRAEFADVGRFPDAARVLLLDSFEEAFATLPVDEQSYVVIVTRGHQHDVTVLAQALRTPATYVGLMSSRSKWTQITAGLRERGLSDEDAARVRTPIGLPIGAETPAELAISIVAEMIQVRAEHKA